MGFAQEAVRKRLRAKGKCFRVGFGGGGLSKILPSASKANGDRELRIDKPTHVAM